MFPGWRNEYFFALYWCSCTEYVQRLHQVRNNGQWRGMLFITLTRFLFFTRYRAVKRNTATGIAAMVVKAAVVPGGTDKV